MSLAYNGLNDDIEEEDEIVLDDLDDNDYQKIKMNNRFTKNPQQSKDKSNQNRGVIAISLDAHSPSDDGLSFDGFEDHELNHNTTQSKPNEPQFIMNSTTQNESQGTDGGATVSKTKKKKKKKKKKYKSKGIDLMPLSAENAMDTNTNAGGGELEEELNGSEKKSKKEKKRKKKQKKRRQRITRNEQIKLYIKNEIGCWLFIGLMLCIFVFSFSAIAVGIAEDIVLFYGKNTDLICHYVTDTDSDGTQTEHKLIGDVLTYKTIQSFFTVSIGCCVVSVVGLIISGSISCLKERAKKMRHSVVVQIVFVIAFEIGLICLFVWNLMLAIDVEDELHEVITDLARCDDEDQSILAQEKTVKDEAHRLFNEFEILIVLILPLIFIIVCTVFYIKLRVR